MVSLALAVDPFLFSVRSFAKLNCDLCEMWRFFGDWLIDWWAVFSFVYVLLWWMVFIDILLLLFLPFLFLFSFTLNDGCGAIIGLIIYFVVNIGYKLLQSLWSFLSCQLLFRSFEHFWFYIIQTGFRCSGTQRCAWIINICWWYSWPFCDCNRFFSLFFPAASELHVHKNQNRKNTRTKREKEREKQWYNI